MLHRQPSVDPAFGCTSLGALHRMRCGSVGQYESTGHSVHALPVSGLAYSPLAHPHWLAWKDMGGEVDPGLCTEQAMGGTLLLYVGQ